MSRSRRQDLASLAVSIRRCTRCALHVSRTQAVPGEGPKRAALFLVGEAPGREEDRRGRPFQGAAGRILDEALGRSRIPRERVFITNAVKCRPPRNRRPRGAELAACRPFLESQLAAIRPKVVVALGQSAAKTLLGPKAILSRARGRWDTLEGTPALVTYHPAAVLYNRALFRKLVADLRKAARRAGGP